MSARGVDYPGGVAPTSHTYMHVQCGPSMSHVTSMHVTRPCMSHVHACHTSMHVTRPCMSRVHVCHTSMHVTRPCMSMSMHVTCTSRHLRDLVSLGRPTGQAPPPLPRPHTAASVCSAGPPSSPRQHTGDRGSSPCLWATPGWHWCSVHGES